MADNKRSTTMSPKAAFSSIRNRLENAVKEGKEKAGIFESIMEASGNGGFDMFDLGEESIFGDPAEEHADDTREPIPDSNHEEDDNSSSIDLGEESVFGDGTGDETSVKTPVPKRVLTGVIGGERPSPTQPATAQLSLPKRSKRLTSAEREEEDRRLREYKRQIDAENIYSVAEISEQWKSLFSYAAENKEYLKDAGTLITEDELRSLFAAEYRNYTDRNHGDATDATVSAVQDVFKEKIAWILKKIDERLHGIGDFMREGSLMKYLYRAATLSKIGRTIVLRKTATLGIIEHTTAGEKTDVLNQFILASDLENCKSWIRGRFNGYNVPDDAIESLALEILANGANKDDVIAKLGGNRNIPRSLYNPKFGSIGSSGEDAVVIGSIDFLGKLNELIDPYLKDSDLNIEQIGLKIGPCGSVLGRKTHGGVMCVKMNAPKFISILNELKSSKLIIPIALGVGVVNTDTIGGGKDDKHGASAAEGLVSHKADDGMLEFSSSFGEQMTANGLMRVLNTPSAHEVARMCNLETELSDALNNPGETGKLAAFSAGLMKWACDTVGVKYSMSSAKGVPIVKPETDKSLTALLKKVVDLGGGKRAVVDAAMLFNNAMQRRFVKATESGDIGDILTMNPVDIRKEAMPTVQLGDLAERCYNTLNKEYGREFGNAGTDDVLTIFGKGYLVYRMGALFGIDTRDLPLVASVNAFKRYVIGDENAPKFSNVKMIGLRLHEMSAGDVVSMANRLESIASEMDVGNKEIGDISFFIDDSIRLDDITQSGLLQSISFISNMEPMECLCRTIEQLTGMPDGTILKYYSELEHGVNKELITEDARFIKNNGDGMIDIPMTDAGKETIRQVIPKPAPTKQVNKVTGVTPRRVGRGRF